MEVGQLLIEIAELKAQKTQAEDDCAYWKYMAKKNAADNSVMAKQLTEALKRERYQKYKRCLAMAKWCDDAARLATWDTDYHRCGWYNKWMQRWLDIAEKFKEAK